MWSSKSSDGSEQEGSFDNVKWDALSEERSGGEPVVRRGFNRGIGEIDVKLDDGVEIGVSINMRVLSGHFLIFLRLAASIWLS
jgi:hypothetical protein